MNQRPIRVLGALPAILGFAGCLALAACDDLIPGINSDPTVTSMEEYAALDAQFGEALDALAARTQGRIDQSLQSILDDLPADLRPYFSQSFQPTRDQTADILRFQLLDRLAGLMTLSEIRGTVPIPPGRAEDITRQLEAVAGTFVDETVRTCVTDACSAYSLRAAGPCAELRTRWPPLPLPH